MGKEEMPVPLLWSNSTLFVIKILCKGDVTPSLPRV